MYAHLISNATSTFIGKVQYRQKFSEIMMTTHNVIGPVRLTQPIVELNAVVMMLPIILFK